MPKQNENPEDSKDTSQEGGDKEASQDTASGDDKDSKSADKTKADAKTKNIGDDKQKIVADSDDSDDIDDSSDTFSREYVQELRAENKKRRVENKKLEEKLNRIEDTAVRRVIRSELKAAAIEAGIVELDALKLVDLSEVKVTEDGDVVGIKEALSKAKEDKPYLFKEKKTSTTANFSTPPVDDEGRKHKAAKDVKEEDISSYMADLRH
jgi:hypothetical protein